MLFLFWLLFIGEKTEEVSEAFITQWAAVLVVLELINSFHSPLIIVPECLSFEESLTSFYNLKCRPVAFILVCFVGDRQICLCSQNFAGSVHLSLFYLLICMFLFCENFFRKLCRIVMGKVSSNLILTG